MKKSYCMLVTLSMLVSVTAFAQDQDRADLEGTSIIGNRELPKVLYIVPWKKPEVGDLIGRPVTSLLDDVLAPVDRDVFRRQVEYHGMLQTPLAVEMGVDGE
jgi:hypothetical protein